MIQQEVFPETCFLESKCMNKEICIKCNRETVSVINTDAGFMCYNCYADSKVPPRSNVHNNEEARMQTEFFKQVSIIFPNLPDRLLFAVPNGGSRHRMEAFNMKLQGVKRGVADVILLIPKNGFSSLCLEFKTANGKQSCEQKEFQQQAENNKSKYVIARSAMQGIEELKKYLT